MRLHERVPNRHRDLERLLSLVQRDHGLVYVDRLVQHAGDRDVRFLGSFLDAFERLSKRVGEADAVGAAITASNPCC